MEHQGSNQDEFKVKKPWSAKAIYTCMFLIGICLFGLWLFYEYYYLPRREIPLLEADKEVTKIRPEKNDGMLVPHMDKIVYEALKPGHNTTKSVSVMPEPEQPIEVTVPSSNDAIEDIIGKVLSENEPQERVSEENEIIKPEIPKDMDVNARTLEIVSVEKQKLKNSQKNFRTQPAYKLQLVSVRTKEIAEKEWLRLKKLHNKLIGGFNHSVQKIDVKNRGVFFRLLVGNFSNSSNAKAICKKLISAQQPCIIVRD